MSEESKPKRVSVSQEPSHAVKYKITPEEMWSCMKGNSQNWGIEGYEIAKKYYDYHQVKWEKERKRIIESHKREWPPKDWPKNKETDKPVPPIKKSFIDYQVEWANSFNDPKKSEEVKSSLESRGTYKYPEPKKPLNLREKFLNEEKEKKEKLANLPQIQPWKENAVENAKKNVEEAKSKVKTQWQKNLEKYPKDKPWWPRADRVSVTDEAQYMGEQVPFYNNYSKDGDDKKKKDGFNPNKFYTMRKAPAWKFQNRNPVKIPNDNMVARDQLLNDKIDALKSAKNYDDKNLRIDVIGSYEKLDRRGRYYISYHKPYDYANTDQYKANKEQHPSFSPGPQHYWKMKEGDVNVRPKETEEDKEINGKPGKVYYMNHKRTDFRAYKPMRKSVF